MVTGWTIEKIQTALGLKTPLVRIMPNTPALVSQGMIAITYSPEVSPENSGDLLKILEGSGLTVTLEEKYFDAVTGLSGSGPGFVFLFIEALADGGVRAGLPRDKALQFAAHTVLGSAAMLLITGKHPGELKDMVTSPGGTTIAGITTLEKSAFRGAVIGAVEAAWQRAAELG
jgi:pyrroline-5-carboxylate reductase